MHTWKLATSISLMGTWAGSSRATHSVSMTSSSQGRHRSREGLGLSQGQQEETWMEPLGVPRVQAAPTAGLPWRPTEARQWVRTPGQSRLLEGRLLSSPQIPVFESTK